MDAKDIIKQNRYRQLKDYGKPKLIPAGAATVTGFQDGLVEVTTGQGSQLREYQGGRAISEGQQLPVHDSSSVFGGRSRKTGEESNAFISASIKKTSLKLALWGYSEALSGSGWVGPDVRPLTFLASDGGAIGRLRYRNIRLILSDGKNMVRIPEWESQAQSLNNYTTIDTPDLIVARNLGIPQIYFYRNLIRVAWGAQTRTISFSDFSSSDTIQVTYHERTLTSGLKPVNYSTIGSSSFSENRSGTEETSTRQLFYYAPAEARNRLIVDGKTMIGVNFGFIWRIPSAMGLSALGAGTNRATIRNDVETANRSSHFFPRFGGINDESFLFPASPITALTTFEGINRKEGRQLRFDGNSYDYSISAESVTSLQTRIDFSDDYQRLIDITELDLPATGFDRPHFQLVGMGVFNAKSLDTLITNPILGPI